MKNRLNIIAISLACCIIFSSANAQDGQVRINLNYNYSLPLGAFKNDYIKNGSPRGFNADILYWANPKWAIGGGFAYQDYYQKYPRGMYKLSDGSDISAVVSNSMQLVPIMAKGVYAPLGGTESVIQPYISAGAGINFVNYSQYLGEFGGNEASVKFTAQGGAGIKIPIGKTKENGFLLGANYAFTPYNSHDIKNLNTVNFQAGFQFKLK
jgi:hypothetical protein